MTDNGDGFTQYGSDDGRAKGHETQSRLAAARRDKHTQLLDAADISSMRKFVHAQFIAFIRGDIKLNSNGTMHFTLQVPYEYRHLAMPMLDAVGTPLSVDVQVWTPYTQATAEDGMGGMGDGVMDLTNGKVE